MSNHKPKYQYNCTDPKSMTELEYVINHMTYIDLSEFEPNVDPKDFKNLQHKLGYSKYLTIDKDWHIKYAKSQLPDKTIVYMLIHSCIEYIFY